MFLGQPTPAGRPTHLLVCPSNRVGRRRTKPVIFAEQVVDVVNIDRSDEQRQQRDQARRQNRQQRDNPRQGDGNRNRR